MKQWTLKEFTKVLNKNDFRFTRYNGSHSIFINTIGKHISIPKSMNATIIRRLIKENSLKI